MVKENKRLTVRLTDEAFSKIDSLVSSGDFEDRSDVIRNALYKFLEEETTPKSAVRILIDIPKLDAKKLEALVESGDALDLEDAIRQSVKEYARTRPKQYKAEQEIFGNYAKAAKAKARA